MKADAGTITVALAGIMAGLYLPEIIAGLLGVGLGIILIVKGLEIIARPPQARQKEKT